MFDYYIDNCICELEKIKNNEEVGFLWAYNNICRLFEHGFGHSESDFYKEITSRFLKTYPYFDGCEIAQIGSQHIYILAHREDLRFKIDFETHEITVWCLDSLYPESPYLKKEFIRQFYDCNTGEALLAYADGKISRREFLKLSSAKTLKSKAVTFLKAKRHIKDKEFIDSVKRRMEIAEKEIVKEENKYKKKIDFIQHNKELLKEICPNLSCDFGEFHVTLSNIPWGEVELLLMKK